ncbi:MAG: transcription termination/antitermination protein NusG [Terriglobia bacterium]
MTKPESPASEAVKDGRWYALYTRHQHERTISQSLQNKGFGTFLPVYAAIHQWKDRTKQLSLPLFPCYVFVCCGNGADWTKVLTTPGIHSVVSFAGQPAVIPRGELEAIRRATESDVQIEPYPFLKCGDWVRVKSGALAGVEGFLIRKKNLFRLVLSVEMLGKSAAVEVDGASVERTVRAGAKLVATPANAGPANRRADGGILTNTT